MVFSKLEALSVRPPTPPKDAASLEPSQEAGADETLQFLQDPFEERPPLPKAAAVTKTLLDTPRHSPVPSSDPSIPSSSARRQKRVNFQLQTCTLTPKGPALHTWTPTRSSPLRPLPQNRVSKPLKSILKPADAAATPPPTNPQQAAHQFKTFADMLESIVKLLASPERPSRMDAYNSLQRTMQAYDKIPDEQALRHKMSLLTQFIERDALAPSPTGAGLDSQLVSQALKLLMALFRIPDAAAAMSDDFCCFIVDRSIHVATDTAMPKTVVNTHLAVLMQQNFRPRIMSLVRVEKIMDMLDTITERVGGFSVQAYRLRIYKKLVQQQPNLMTKHTERWFKHTLKAFMTNQKDINQSALDVSLCAAKNLNHEPSLARSCLAVLNRIRADGEVFAKIMAKELERMLAGDNATMVPQIWSAVTILLRGVLHTQSFAALKEWLQVFESCLTTNKEPVRVQTNVAFGFLIYAVNLSENTSEAWATILVKTPLHQLQRRIPANKSERDAVSSGYLTLLYYALQPTAPHAQLDRFWRDFVASFWTPLIHLASSPHPTAACTTVAVLLNGSRQPWSEQRALDHKPQCMIKRNELPRLDPRWVRRSLSIILPFVENLLDATPWSNNERHEEEPVRTMWTAVLDSLVEASCKEVMATSETKDAMAHVVNLLRRMWENHTAKLAVPQHKEALWSGKFCFLIDTVIKKLGALQFTDKCLTRNRMNDFEVVSTPSHRSKQYSQRLSPLLYFVDVVVNQSEGRLGDAVRMRVLQLILEPCLHAQTTCLSRLELLRDCSALVNSHSSTSTGVIRAYWANVATLLQSSLQGQRQDSNQQDSRALGREYQIIVEILASGSGYFLTDAVGEDLLMNFIEAVRREAGEPAIILAVIEKVAESIIVRISEDSKVSCLTYTAILLRNIPQQISRRSLDQTRQRLWPSSEITPRQTNFDPYNYLYDALVGVSLASYRDMDDQKFESIKDFLTALSTSIKACATSHLAVYLRKTQDAIRVWIEDKHCKMRSITGSMRPLYRAILQLWREVTQSLLRLPRKDSQVLLHLEPLITAGFITKRRSIVNISIESWNNTFGQEADLRYSTSLEHVLLRLHKIAELSLPSLDIRSDEETEDLSFYESDVSDDERQPHADRVHKTTPLRLRDSASYPDSTSQVLSTPSSRRKPAHNTPKVRLRHDNSQIVFEPIISSPSNPFDQESQVLTERQREMYERQRATGAIFADITSPSPHDITLPPIEIFSDAVTVNESPMQQPRATPMKGLPDMGPMDVYLGSSPTPHARREKRFVGSDQMSIATPTAVRPIAPHMDEAGFGSSPPRFEKAHVEAVQQAESNDLISNTQLPQPEDVLMSLQEDPVEENDTQDPEPAPNSDSEEFSDIALADVLSSSLDLQLTAQLDAEIEAHMGVAPDQDPASLSQHPHLPVEQVEAHASANPRDRSSPASSTVLNTEAALAAESNDASHLASPLSRNLRRSSRRTTSSPLHVSSPRRSKRALSDNGSIADARDTPIALAKTRSTLQAEVTVSEPVDEPEMFDNIVVESPAKSRTRTKKRKSTSALPSSQDSVISVVHQERKRGPIRRSQSLLGLVENSQEDVFEEHRAPKRARQKEEQDVSEVRIVPSTVLESQSTRQFNHVQVTPRRSSSIASQDTPAVTNGEGRASTILATPSRSFAERVILTPRSIIDRLKSLKDYLLGAPQLVLGREEEREIAETIMHIQWQVHAAGVRGEDQQKVTK